MGHAENLIGKVFGRLTVVEKVKRGRRAYWKCVCECGQITTVNTYRLKNGEVFSCGCGRKNYLVGKVFGRLTVEKQVDGFQKRRYWLCKCESDYNRPFVWERKIVWVFATGKKNRRSNKAWSGWNTFVQNLEGNEIAVQLPRQYRLQVVWSNWCYSM